MMQLSFLTPTPARKPRQRRAYAVQGQERPADLPRLQESAETMQEVVLWWFSLFKDSRHGATASQCAHAYSLT